MRAAGSGFIPWESHIILSKQAHLVSSLKKYVFYMCSLMSAKQMLV